MNTLLHGAWDETKRVFLDGGVMLISLFAVILYSFFYPIPYAPEVLHDIPVAVIDADGSALSRNLVRMLDAHESMHVAVRCESMADAERLLQNGDVKAVVSIPRDMERDVLRGRHVVVPAHIDAAYMLVYSTVFKGLIESAGTLSAGVEIARFRAAGMTAEAAMRARQPVVTDFRPLFSLVGGYGAYVIPAVLVLVLQQTLLIGAGIAGGTLREQAGSGREAARQSSVFAPAMNDVGRAMPYLVLYAANAWYCFYFTLDRLGYRPQGSAAAMALFTASFLVATTLMGLAVRGLFRRRETAVQLLLASSLVFIFLGGFSWPVEAMPGWLRIAARLVPTTSAIPAFIRISRMGATLADVAVETKTLWILAGIYFPLACWANRKSVYTPVHARQHPVPPGA